MSDFGIVYEADLSVRRYNSGVLSKELIGPMETTVFTMKPESETKERKAYRIGQAGKTRGSIGRTLATKIKIGVNAVDARLMALIMLGTTAALSVAGGSAVAEAVTVQHDVWIKLDNHNITAATAAIATFTEGADFEIDETLGAIMALSTGGMTDDTSYDISYVFGAIAGTTIRAGTESKTDVYLEGPTKNRETGLNGRIRIPKVTLSLASDLSLLADDYVDAEMDGTCVLLDGESADMYIDENVVYS